MLVYYFGSPCVIRVLQSFRRRLPIPFQRPSVLTITHCTLHGHCGLELPRTKIQCTSKSKLTGRHHFDRNPNRLGTGQAQALFISAVDGSKKPCMKFPNWATVHTVGAGRSHPPLHVTALLQHLRHRASTANSLTGERKAAARTQTTLSWCR